MRREIPSEYIVTGARIISENSNLSTVVWEWYKVEATQLRRDRNYSQITSITSVALSVVPFVAIITLNHLIYKTIKRKTFLLSNSSSKEKRDIFVAGILILIVIVYATCHTIKCIINLVELLSTLQGTDLDDHPKLQVLVALSHLLLTVNNSVNFAIYCIKVESLVSILDHFYLMCCSH